jgi:acyl-CoA reductase-like NAD-dependent aldehyde dehydrogenase
VIETEDPASGRCSEELFGPVVTTYVYDDKRWDDTLKLVDEGAPYALTGAVFADDRYAVEEAHQALATRPATSTSTTSRPAPSSASSRSAADELRARTIRQARCGT